MRSFTFLQGDAFVPFKNVYILGQVLDSGGTLNYTLCEHVR